MYCSHSNEENAVLHLFNHVIYMLSYAKTLHICTWLSIFDIPIPMDNLLAAFKSEPKWREKLYKCNICTQWLNRLHTFNIYVNTSANKCMMNINGYLYNITSFYCKQTKVKCPTHVTVVNFTIFNQNSISMPLKRCRLKYV